MTEGAKPLTPVPGFGPAERDRSRGRGGMWGHAVSDIECLRAQSKLSAWVDFLHAGRDLRVAASKFDVRFLYPVG